MNKIVHWIIISVMVMGYIACGDLLKNINSSNDIPNKTTIENGEYQNKGYQKIVLQDTVTSIGKSAFQGNKLKAIRLPKSVRNVGEKAFLNNPLEKVILSRRLYNSLKDKLDIIFGTREILYQDFDGKELKDSDLNTNGRELKDSERNTIPEVKNNDEVELKNNDEAEVKNKTSAADLKEASIQLASKFYAAAIKGSKKNVLISPYGLKSVLAMTSLTLSKENEKELARAIFLNPDEDYLQAVSEQFKTLNSSEVLKIANRMWVDDDLALNKGIMTRIGTYFDSPIHLLDLGAEDAKKTINDVLATLTNNKIENFFSRIDPLTKAILANALYFNADWKYEFKQAESSQWENYDYSDTDTNIKFYNSVKKAEISIPLNSIMHIKSNATNIPYFTIEGDYEITNKKGVAKKASIKVASIPYKDENTSMIVILPGIFGGLGKNFKSLETNIGKILPAILRKLDTFDPSGSTGNIEIAMPKFKTEWDGSLIPMLDDLGMSFLKNASFDRLANSEEDLSIGDIKQKTFIELTLTGTEAAAVTVVDFRRRSGTEPNLKEMRLNRSFLYLIRNNETGAILFMGRFSSPS